MNYKNNIYEQHESSGHVSYNTCGLALFWFLKEQAHCK